MADQDLEQLEPVDKRTQEEIPKRPRVTDRDLSNLAAQAADGLGEDVEEGAPLWTITFADMMSLLLTFFILLFSMSEVKMAKFQQAAASLRQGFGQSEIEVKDVIQSGDPFFSEDSLTSSITTVIEESEVDAELKNIARKLQEFIEENSLESTLTVMVDPTATTLLIQDVVLFLPASADITPGNRWIIEKLGQLAVEIEVPVVISGHTDSIPIVTKIFPSNWELSSARASRVAREIITMGFAPESVHIEGFAEFRPIESNVTPEGRAANRRVEFRYTRGKVMEKLVREKDELIYEN